MKVNSNGTSPIYFNDPSVATDNSSYHYETPCGYMWSITFPPSLNNPSSSHDTSLAETILLEVETNKDYSAISSLDGQYTNTVTFNEYNKWLGDVIEYRLYRSVNREPFNLIPIYKWDRQNNPNEELKYIDVVTEFGDGNGRFCYYIQAVEGPANIYGSTTEGSLSNIACVSQTPILFVPSVFTLMETNIMRFSFLLHTSFRIRLFF